MKSMRKVIVQTPDDHQGTEREFVESFEFSKRWKSLKLDDDDFGDLQARLCADPQAGDKMAGTGGVRKLRLELPGRGKSGGARIVYVDFAVEETIYLITVFAKNEKGNLNNREKKEIRDFVDSL